ncbi:hypothetical protein FGO68_gene14834 [Halteria grandinella]|uniref:Uncharacterized protein n=1 Tax=Halteria grandinella TaxID=5974 RepID=A0A8J8P8M5_HALGN|nr:hypothetical protein FGO68_gene14834 [Halteria grandinella]
MMSQLNQRQSVKQANITISINLKANWILRQTQKDLNFKGQMSKKDARKMTLTGSLTISHLMIKQILISKILAIIVASSLQERNKCKGKPCSFKRYKMRQLDLGHSKLSPVEFNMTSKGNFCIQESHKMKRSKTSLGVKNQAAGGVSVTSSSTGRRRQWLSKALLLSMRYWKYALLLKRTKHYRRREEFTKIFNRRLNSLQMKLVKNLLVSMMKTSKILVLVSIMLLIEALTRFQQEDDHLILMQGLIQIFEILFIIRDNHLGAA